MQKPVTWEDFYVPSKNTKPLLSGAKIFKSAYDWELSEKDKERVRVEVRETEEKKEKCLHELKEKLLKSKKFNYRNDEFYLLRFLRIRKYDCNKAYENMKKLYQMREERPTFFAVPSNLKYMLDRNIISILPYSDAEGRTMFWWQPALCNSDEKSIDEMIQMIIIFLDLATLNPKLQINGVIGVWDTAGVTVNHALQILKGNRLFSLLSFVQNITAYRIHKVLIPNTSRIIRLLYNVLRPLINRKVADRVFMLGSDTSELHQHVDPLLLPKKLGGALEEEECVSTEYILNNLGYIRHDRSFSVK